MKLITNGHDEGAQRHIEGVVMAIYDEVYPIVERALAGTLYAFGGNPKDTYPGTLTIVTHPSYWTTPEGTHAGLTHWFPPNADSKIEFDWSVDAGEMNHEWCHWLGLQAGHPHWGAFAHGTKYDPILQMMQRDVDKVYSNFKVGRGES